jgi:hypothetical protein
MTAEFVVSFYLFALLGMGLTLLMHLSEAIGKSNKTSKRFKFKWRFWLKDNYIRIITNLIVIFVVLRFYDSLGLKYKLDMFLGFVAGFSIDGIIILLREKTKINIFQTTKYPSD